jgi:hypothetical protein
VASADGLDVRGRRTTDGVDGGQRPDHLCFTTSRWTLPPDSPPPSQVRPRGGESGGSRSVLPRRQSESQRERDGRKRQWSLLPSRWKWSSDMPPLDGPYVLGPICTTICSPKPDFFYLGKICHRVILKKLNQL